MRTPATVSLRCEACDQGERLGSISVPTSVAAIGIRAAGASMFGFRSEFAIGSLVVAERGTSERPRDVPRSVERSGTFHD